MPILFKSLRQRFFVLLLLPVALLLVAMGGSGYLFARNTMLKGWETTALFSQARAAHTIDMRLAEPGHLVEVLAGTTAGLAPALLEERLVGSLKTLPGVARASLAWRDAARAPAQASPFMRGAGRGGMGGPGGRGQWAGMGGMFRRAVIAKVAPPTLDAATGKQSVTLTFSLLNADNREEATLSVSLDFAVLLQDLAGYDWWKSQTAFLVSRNGQFLATTAPLYRQRTRLGENGDALERAVLKALGKNKPGTVLGPGRPPSQVAGYYPLKSAPWTMVLVAPGERVLAPIINFRDWFVVSGLVLTVLVLALILKVTGGVSKAMEQLSQAAGMVAGGNLDVSLATGRGDEIGRSMQSFNRMVEGLRERDFIRNTFGRYVDPEVAGRLLSGPEAVALGGEKRTVAVLMSDIRGFTAMAEKLDPADTLLIINAYLSRLIEVIQAHQGVIVDFLGDAILAFFDPGRGPAQEAARRAVQCGLTMQNQVTAINLENRAQGKPELNTAIGIHLDQVVVGNIGSQTRTKFGIVGAAVNFTHRLQASAEGGETVVSRAVVAALGKELDLARSYQARMKGIEGEVTVFVLAPGQNGR